MHFLASPEKKSALEAQVLKVTEDINAPKITKKQQIGREQVIL